MPFIKPPADRIQGLESNCQCSSWKILGNRCSCFSKVLRATKPGPRKRRNSCLEGEVSTIQSHFFVWKLMSRFTYNNWRPVTAINRPGIWLSTGLNVSDPSWTPLLIPTPSHPDYVSTHSTFGGAASAVIRAFNKGSDKINITVSSNVTLDNRGVITRRYTNLTAAAIENGDSRVFGGVSSYFGSSTVLTCLDSLSIRISCWNPSR